MKPISNAKINPHEIVDQLYDIAIDPESLAAFIGAWNDAGLDTQEARQTIEKIDQFDAAYADHLQRAETFLKRALGRVKGPDFAAMLAPFQSLAAFVVDCDQCVVAANAGAEHAFGLEKEVCLDILDLPETSLHALQDCLRTAFRSPKQSDRLIKVDLATERGTALFQVHKLMNQPGQNVSYALVVTTQYHWQAALGQTLHDVFLLTAAEQAVVRALVEGMDAKTVATMRNTSEGTVRGQIKSILAKMNARTQSEVIRLVMSLHEISKTAQPMQDLPRNRPDVVPADWLHAEVWKPFETVTLPDGRRMDYLDMGPNIGAPILFTHMGYGMARWHRPMISLAFKLGLRVIVPMRAGYGHSENVGLKEDILAVTRADTLFLLNHLGIDRLPYVPQGNDLVFAMDLAAHVPDRISEIIGICARPSLVGDEQYASMSKWHRFFLSTAKHAPHLLKFTAKAAVSMCKRIGVLEMFRHMNGSSVSDMSLLESDHLRAVLMANGELVAGKTTDVSQAYVMELLVSEAPWNHIMTSAKGTPTRFINGADDPTYDAAAIAAYRDAYPWINIDVVQNAGQLLIYKQYEQVLPMLAEAAKRAQPL
jgi:pimeloyl-ACP methyl ester carboxylesterase/DNA-binding CsgD family transcriptional regulator